MTLPQNIQEVFSIKDNTKKDKALIASGFFFIVFFVKLILIKEKDDLSLPDLIPLTIFAATAAGIFFILKYPFNSR